HTGWHYSKSTQTACLDSHLGKMDNSGISSYNRRNWRCLIVLLSAYFTVTKDSSHGALHFQHRFRFPSWMRHPLEGERNVPGTSLASRKDTEPCSTSRTTTRCTAASRPQRWVLGLCDS